jgi:zona occludens toxin
VITLKSGVPGSGKTLSMVHELLAMSKDTANPRPLYTNITGLSIPHFPLTDCTKWRECPVNSLIVIDEAFLAGYEAKSAQGQVPDYIRDLAIHRKDFSVDIWFIAQHPKLLHVALRRQVGKHQHYRRLFGWGRSVVYEWDQCQENLSATKSAVASNFGFPKSSFAAYKSAEVHTKPKFKLPWWAWLPIAIIPAAVWAFPAAYGTLSGAMLGKGIPRSGEAPKPSALVPQSLVALPVSTVPVPVSTVAPGQHSDIALVAPPDAPPAGCVAVPGRCGCFDAAGAKVEVKPGVCESIAGVGRGKPAEFADSPVASIPLDAGERDALAYAFRFDKKRVLTVTR